LAARVEVIHLGPLDLLGGGNMDFIKDAGWLVQVIPLATFWVSFNAIAGACKLAHEQKEKLVRKDFPQEYAAILRSDAFSLCVGVVFAILVFTAALGWLAVALWNAGKAYQAPSILVGLEAVFAALSAWMFLLGTVRFRHRDWKPVNETTHPSASDPSSATGANLQLELATGRPTPPIERTEPAASRPLRR
jgi:hypothetical protein